MKGRLTEETFLMTLRDALRTLEGAARYDAKMGSSRSSRLTRQRRYEVEAMVMERLGKSPAAADEKAGGGPQTGLDTIHKSPEGKRAISGAGETQPLTKGPGGESGIPGRQSSDLIRQETSEGAHVCGNPNCVQYDSTRVFEGAARDGKARGSGAASGTVPAAVQTTVSSGPAPSDPARQDARAYRCIGCGVNEGMQHKSDCGMPQQHGAGSSALRGRASGGNAQDAAEIERLRLRGASNSLASLARRLLRERDEARRLHDFCCGHGLPCTPPWRPR